MLTMSKSWRAPHPYTLLLMLLLTRGLDEDGEHARDSKFPMILAGGASMMYIMTRTQGKNSKS